MTPQEKLDLIEEELRVTTDWVNSPSDWDKGAGDFAATLIDKFFTKEEDPAQLPLEFPPNCS